LTGDKEMTVKKHDVGQYMSVSSSYLYGHQGYQSIY